MTSLARGMWLAAAIGATATLLAGAASAQERLPWMSGQGQYDTSRQNDAYRPSDPYRPADGYRQGDAYGPSDGSRQGEASRPSDGYRQSDAYRPPGAYRRGDAYAPPVERVPRGDAYQPQPPPGGYVDNYRRGRGYVSDQPPGDDRGGAGYGAPYAAPPGTYGERGYGHDEPPPPASHPRSADYGRNDGTYSQSEILSAGHRFFGSISQGLANVIEYAFKQSGRPNGYILGEDAGGAFVAGLRYGEGVLYTKDAGSHKVYWQGPSLGYDFGAEGSKTMVLVYNLRDPAEIYTRFGGVQGSAYVIGGVSIQFQKNDDIMLAPIRAGVGLRLGANVGYLKYTRTPTWNPF